VELGIGAGWYEEEHRAYGIPFPPVGERFDRLEEQLAVITGLWETPAGETFSHPGRYYPIKDSPALAKPVQRPLPIIVGGGGPRRTPRLAARYAAEFNRGFVDLDTFRRDCERVRAACEQMGRDPATLVWSAALPVCCGRDEAEVERRARAIGREPDELRRTAVAGTVDEVVRRLAAWAEAGAARMYLQVLDLADLEHIRLIGSEVRPRLT
jgi:alkanesulfonate monooxygenase SsuD/methylene tetrahydromethanopterin reductase-like flavin-dependent oxidoreductase (luciferase family)